jgi:zinc/manganese transport system permease protein
VLLTFALLVAPAATAQQMTPRIARSLALAVALALLEAWAALALSYFTNLALGFAVTTIALALYALARGSRELRR